jgi:hypothetical protein
MRWNKLAATQGPKQRPMWIYWRTVRWLERAYWNLIEEIGLTFERYHRLHAPTYLGADEDIAYFCGRRA